MNLDVNLGCEKSRFDFLKAMSWTAAAGNIEDENSIQKTNDGLNLSSCQVDTNFDGVVFCPNINIIKAIDYSDKNLNVKQQKKEIL